jgi:hypothetical protein
MSEPNPPPRLQSIICARLARTVTARGRSHSLVRLPSTHDPVISRKNSFYIITKNLNPASVKKNIISNASIQTSTRGENIPDAYLSLHQFIPHHVTPSLSRFTSTGSLVHSFSSISFLIFSPPSSRPWIENFAVREVYVATVHSRCFRGFKGTWQAFHVDVAKIDLRCCNVPSVLTGVAII